MIYVNCSKGEDLNLWLKVLDLLHFQTLLPLHTVISGVKLWVYAPFSILVVFISWG